MKGFIEVQSSEGSHKPVLIGLNAIGLVEQYSSSESRIILNVRLTSSDQNQYIMCRESYQSVKQKIAQAIAEG